MNGSTAATPNGSRCRRLRDRIVRPWRCAVAAMTISANPGACPRPRARSDSTPAIRAVAASNERIRSLYKCRTVSSQAVSSELLRVAPSRRSLAIPSSISATVTADMDNEAEWVSIHSTSAADTDLDGATADKTLVSTRYTGNQRPDFRNGDLLRAGKSFAVNGAAINKRPKLGTVVSRSHSS